MQLENIKNKYTKTIKYQYNQLLSMLGYDIYAGVMTYIILMYTHTIYISAIIYASYHKTLRMAHNRVVTIAVHIPTTHNKNSLPYDAASVSIPSMSRRWAVTLDCIRVESI